MFPNVVEADRQLHAQAKASQGDWVSVQFAEDDAECVVRALYFDPYPLALAGLFVFENRLDIIANLILRHFRRLLELAPYTAVSEISYASRTPSKYRRIIS